MEVKVEVKGPQGCGKTALIDDISDFLVDTFGRCAVQTKEVNHDHKVTFIVSQGGK